MTSSRRTLEQSLHTREERLTMSTMKKQGAKKKHQNVKNYAPMRWLAIVQSQTQHKHIYISWAGRKTIHKAENKTGERNQLPEKTKTETQTKMGINLMHRTYRHSTCAGNYKKAKINVTNKNQMPTTCRQCDISDRARTGVMTQIQQCRSW